MIRVHSRSFAAKPTPPPSATYRNQPEPRACFRSVPRCSTSRNACTAGSSMVCLRITRSYRSKCSGTKSSPNVRAADRVARQTIGFLRRHAVGRRQVPVSDPVDIPRSAPLHPRLPSISSSSARLPDPGSRFANRTFFRARSSIFRIFFGLPGATTRPSSHSRERHHPEILIRKLVFQERQVEFAGFRIFQMRPGDVYLAFAQPRQRQFAGAAAVETISMPADLLHHARQQARRRIAPRQHQPLLKVFFLAKTTRFARPP